jgi:hypothetical protein
MHSLKNPSKGLNPSMTWCHNLQFIGLEGHSKLLNMTWNLPSVRGVVAKQSEENTEIGSKWTISKQNGRWCHGRRPDGGTYPLPAWMSGLLTIHRSQNLPKSIRMRTGTKFSAQIRPDAAHTYGPVDFRGSFDRLLSRVGFREGIGC